MYLIIGAYLFDFAFNENETLETKKTRSISLPSC